MALPPLHGVLRREEMTREEARNKWIEELRSGKYQQAKSCLHRIYSTMSYPIGYCCLGVACDLFADELKLKRSSTVFQEMFDGCQSTLPAAVVKFLGLVGNAGESKNNPAELTLASLNDNGKTFNEIADALETGEFWIEL